MDLEDIRNRAFPRRPGARPFNADVIAGEEYRKHLDDYEKNWRTARN